MDGELGNWSVVPMKFLYDLSRRGSRVAGRSDAVLHHSKEAQPFWNGCIVVNPAGLRFVLGCVAE